MRPRDVVAGALAVLVFVSRPASAGAQDESPRAFGVRGPEAQRAWADAVVRAMRDEYRARGLEVIEAPTSPTAVVLVEELSLARDSYTHLRPAEALRIVDGVIARFEAAGGNGLDQSGYVDALLLRALAALALGLGAEADGALAAALAVDPSLAPDPAQYPPSLLTRLERQRALFPETPGVVSLHVEPAAFELSVDGVEVRPIDRRLPLRAGRHVLRFDAALRSSETKIVEVVAGEEIEVHVALEPSPEALASPVAEGASAALLAQAAHRLGASLVLLDVRATTTGLVVRARDTARRRAGRVSARPDELAAAVAARLAALLLAPEVARDDASERRRRRVRIGASTGAAVAAALGATLVGVLTRDRGREGFVGQWSRDAP